MKQLILDIPDNLELDAREAKRFLAAKMYERGKLSQGQATDLAGFFKVAFAEILADYDVSLVNYSPSEIVRDAAQF